MTKFIAIAALAATTFAGAASAMATDAEEAKIRFYVPNADVQSLTETEVASVLAVIDSTDSVSELLAKVRGFLN